MIALDVLSICIFQYGKLEISSGHRLGRKSYPLSCREIPFNHGQNVLSERKTTRKKALQQVGCATEEAFMVGKQLQTAQLPCVPQDPTAWTFFSWVDFAFCCWGRQRVVSLFNFQIR